MAKLERHVSSHHFASTALLCFGVSCAHKGELTAEESNRIGLRPSEVSATVIDSGVAVCWNRTRREKVAHYKVYRRESAVSSWQQLISTVATGDDAGTYQFLDQTTRAGAVYVYGVSAEPVSGWKGAFHRARLSRRVYPVLLKTSSPDRGKYLLMPWARCGHSVGRQP